MEGTDGQYLVNDGYGQFVWEDGIGILNQLQKDPSGFATAGGGGGLFPFALNQLQQFFK